MSELLPHQQRVVDEKRELDEKISKLGPFLNSSIFKSLDGDEQERLCDQYEVMQVYSNILRDRIAAF